METSQGNFASCKGKIVFLHVQDLVESMQQAVEDNASPNLWHKRQKHMCEKGCNFWRNSPSFFRPKFQYDRNTTYAAPYFRLKALIISLKVLKLAGVHGIAVE
ncbi:hypothetical protein RJ641_000552, partial [Dillenia turbinata]